MLQFQYGYDAENKIGSNRDQNSVTTNRQKELAELAKQNLAKKFPKLEPLKRLIRLERNSISTKRLNEKKFN